MENDSILPNDNDRDEKTKKPIELNDTNGSLEEHIKWGSSYPKKDTANVDTPKNRNNINENITQNTGENNMDKKLSTRATFSDFVDSLNSKFHLHEKNWLHMIILGILCALLLFSLVNNIKLSKDVASYKSKALSNANVAKKLLVEKERILEENKPFKNKNVSLQKELESTQYLKNSLAEQNQKLKSKLVDSEQKYAAIDQKLNNYSEELEKIISEKLELYSIYEQEKAEKDQLAQEISELENKIGALNKELGGIDTKYVEHEAKRIYDMAFIYAKAGMIDETIKSFKRYMNLNGETADMHYNLAVIYDDVKLDKTNASKHYKRYLELNPNAIDFFEITMRLESLQRIGKLTDTKNMKNFKINLNDLKY